MKPEDLIKATEAAYQRGESAAIIAKTKIEAWEAARVTGRAARDAARVAQDAADTAEDVARDARDAWVEADTEHDDAWLAYNRLHRLLKRQEKYQAREAS
jgi:cell division septum initiation protein DivIVA